MKGQAETVPDDRLLTMLRQNEPGGFEILYRSHFRMVASYINNHNGSDDDARDIFQEVLFVFVKKVRDPEFTLTSKISTYLYAIATNLWKKRSTRKKEFYADNQDLMRLPMGVDQPEAEAQDQENLLEGMLEKMQELESDCRQLILLSFYEKKSQQEIASLTGYSESYVKVKKFRCLGYLRNLVKALPAFKDLL